MKYWLMKSEGDCYPISELKKVKSTAWTGVRNFQARNYMREMCLGDMILFYHSSSKTTGVYGLAEVSKIAHPDMTAQNSKDEHFDPRATREKPLWECVDIAHIETFKEPVPLDSIRRNKKLSKMILIQRGSRLSIMPVDKLDFEEIVRMSKLPQKNNIY
jgi:predicted RNA-binding protein with PUA-like domain